MSESGYSRPFHPRPSTSVMACKQTFARPKRVTAPDQILPSAEPSNHVCFRTNTGSKSCESRHRRKLTAIVGPAVRSRPFPLSDQSRSSWSGGVGVCLTQYGLWHFLVTQPYDAWKFDDGVYSGNREVKVLRQASLTTSHVINSILNDLCEAFQVGNTLTASSTNPSRETDSIPISCRFSYAMP